MRNRLLLFTWFIFFVGCLLVADKTHAQAGIQNPNGFQEQRIAEPAKARPGTYRFILEPGGEQEYFTEDVLVIAEQLRMDHQRVRYALSDLVTIEIYSRDELRDRQPSQIGSLNDNRAIHEN